jgi:hypothetical protein
VCKDKLLDVEYDLNDGMFISQWAAYLRATLHQSENIQVVNEAAKCLGTKPLSFCRFLPYLNDNS